MLHEKIKYALWGCGNYMENTIRKIPQDLNILYFCDEDYRSKNKKYRYGDKFYECIDPMNIKDSAVDKVIVSVQSDNIFESIRNRVSAWGISAIHINELVLQNRNAWEEEQMRKYDMKMNDKEEPDNYEKLISFISINVPIDYCNLQCEYCYVGQNQGFFKKKSLFFSPQFIRKALSRKRINGTALINFCGTGETLLCDELIDIVAELLNEGHYISIITNALVTKNIEKLLVHEKVDHLFFKCSFHYLQLLKGHRLEIFENNIRAIKTSGASYSIELVPHDELIPYIDGIKEYSNEKFGALPHVTVARDESTMNMEILTNYSNDEYNQIWKCFDSNMFTFKMDNLRKQTDYCLAGKGAYLVDLCTGATKPCPGGNVFTNIYDAIDEPINASEVGSGCLCSYCFNNHAYLSLGLVKTINGCSYADIRDRKCIDGSFWLSDRIRNIFSQRICDNLEE